MNTRMLVTSESWFGGGGDLTPVLDYQRQPDFPDTIDFHAAMKAACDPYDESWYTRMKNQCDEYFHLTHRNEPRGSSGNSQKSSHSRSRRVGRAVAAR